MDDPLAHLMLSVDGQRAAYLALHDLAHEVTGGRWVVTGGGGYALVDVVPRAWTHLLAIVAGAARPRDRDPGGLARLRARLGSERRHRITDGAPRLTATGPRATTPRLAGPGHPRDPDRGLPLHGLDPCPEASAHRRTERVATSTMQADTPNNITQVSLVQPFPTSHMWLYCHEERGTWSTGGEAGDARRRKVRHG